ncbi:MAG TPA: DUF4388 domain-containing protein [Kofleriaceae bacterium]|nr:DUF4388 domain-containing protein [Kofleriaceae bacterium]
MSALAKVIILDSDPLAGAQLAWTLGRVGLTATVMPLTVATSTITDAVNAGVQALVLGDHKRAMLETVDRADPKPLLDRTREIRNALTAAGLASAMVVVGEKVRRGDAEAAGATEAMTHPLHSRDVGMVLNLLLNEQGKPWSGNLGDTASVYRLMRGLCAVGRSGVLSMMRGLRRGEIRFYHGEITSAQVSLTHGQAALHQLLLWTDAKFEFRREDVVRRQQIPLSMADLFAEAQRFLDRMHDASSGLSPADRLERDEAKMAELGPTVPKPVSELLRLFDGNRTLADVLEDSPYRQFETLRVTLRGVEAGILRQVATEKPKATWRALLAIEEWLVGIDRASAQQRVMALASETDTGKHQLPTNKKHKKKRRARTQGQGMPLNVEPSPPSPTTITWGDLVPRESQYEIEAVSQVVPTAEVSGEIALRAAPSSRAADREGLETQLDSGTRQRVFVADLANELPVEKSGEIKVARQPLEAGRPVDTTVFVADAEVARTSAMQAAAAQAARPVTKSPATPAAAQDANLVAAVSQEASKLARDFTDDEEQFFSAGNAVASPPPKALVATDEFADLDEGYEHQSFWDRLLGKKPKRR